MVFMVNIFTNVCIPMACKIESGCDHHQAAYQQSEMSLVREYTLLHLDVVEGDGFAREGLQSAKANHTNSF
jgi:hypothetical protein